MTLLAAGMTIPVWLAPFPADTATKEATHAKFAVAPVAIYLAGYFLFGAGYIAYMTFMIAYIRDGGGGALAQSAFWSLIGLSAFVTPWVWRRVLALDRGGLATTIILGVNAIGAALPIFGQSPLLLAISALVFGVAFFAVVGSTTAFVRFNYPPAAWPTAIAAMTIAFGIGQTIGPIVVGAITDVVGSLSFALNVSAAMLALGAILSAFQGKLKS
jgi:MFS family permease